MLKPPFSQVWTAILDQAGQPFMTRTGLPFTYHVSGEGLFPDRTQYRIPRSDVEMAYGLVPLSGPGQINHLVRGPAYIWAILHDRRISGGAW